MAKWIWQDYIIIIALALHFVAIFATIYLNFNVASITHVNVTTAATATEQNPLQRNLVTAQYFEYITGFLVSGILIAVYISLKKFIFDGWLIDNKPHLEFLTVLNMIVLSLFLINASDAANDLAYLAAIIFK